MKQLYLISFLLFISLKSYAGEKRKETWAFEMDLWPELSVAIYNSEYNKIINLINNGVDVNKKAGQYKIDAMQIAIRTQNIRALKLLLNSKRVAYDSTCKYYYYAAIYSNIKIMKLLSSYSFKYFEAPYNNPIFEAAKSSSPLVIEYLISIGANVNSLNLIGSTPLIVAAAAGNYKNVKILLKHGADKTIKNRNGDNALSIMISSNINWRMSKKTRVKIIELLLDEYWHK